MGVPPFTGVAVNVTLVPEHIAPAGAAAILTEGATVGVSDNEPKFVAPLIPVKPVAVDAVRFPAPEPAPVAWICKPAIVTWSICVVLFAKIASVSVVAVNEIKFTPVIFLPGVNAKVGVAAVLNCQPAGTLITSPCGMGAVLVISPLRVSVIVIVPSVVKPAFTPPTALLAHILVPPEAGVTVMAALALNEYIPTNNTIKDKIFFITID